MKKRTIRFSLLVKDFAPHALEELKEDTILQCKEWVTHRGWTRDMVDWSQRIDSKEGKMV
jgi:hypothetical protein